VASGPSPSLGERVLPAWYDDAKLGIMIHWGPFAVPAWAERTLDPEVIFTDPTSPDYFLTPQGVESFLRRNPYSEWYWNSSSIEGSAAWQHHRDTWGADFPYERFADLFEETLGGWDPEAWARTFRDAGARYVVLVTKHHDGYTLWPSDVSNPNRASWQTPRDVVGELSGAVRQQCMRMGLYYSGGIDWTFRAPPFASFNDALRLTPPQEEYARYVDAHWRELIDRYRPAILWNDIGAPPATDPEALFREYWSSVPDGVVNDRWAKGLGQPSGYRDFRTAEFEVLEDISPDKWEAVRGMSRGFGFNQNEVPEDYGPPEKFVHMLVDVVSKNGNLLLNVGPRGDGTIPEEQLRILATLGSWLGKNGDAIYGTRPWTHATAETDGGVPVRFTRSADGRFVYATFLGSPAPGAVTIEGFTAAPKRVLLLDGGQTVDATSTASGLRLTLPRLPAGEPAHVVAIELAG